MPQIRAVARRFLKGLMSHAAVLTILLQGMLSAQDITGDWQGTLKLGKSEEWVVATIAKKTNGWVERGRSDSG